MEGEHGIYPYLYPPINFLKTNNRIMKRMIFSMIMMSALGAFAQSSDFKMPMPSPTTTVQQTFSTSYIGIEYSRPSTNGRAIFGSLVPYGNVWRTGANSASKISFGEDVALNGIPVPAGSYSLYTIPGEKVWTIILNKNTGNWGTSGFDKKDDVAEFKVPVQVTSDKTETFTISVDNITSKSCELALSWANTRVPIKVTTDNDARIMTWLNKELQGDKPPYQQAASYYLDNGKDLKLALDYANKSIEANPKAFYLHWLKARVLSKMGNKKDALKAAKVAADAAANTPYAIEYQNNYESLK